MTSIHVLVLTPAQDSCSFYILIAIRIVTFQSGNTWDAFQISTEKSGEMQSSLTERHLKCSRFTVAAKRRKSPRVGTKISLACFLCGQSSNVSFYNHYRRLFLSWMQHPIILTAESGLCMSSMFDFSTEFTVAPTVSGVINNSIDTKHVGWRNNRPLSPTNRCRGKQNQAQIKCTRLLWV